MKATSHAVVIVSSFAATLAVACSSSTSGPATPENDSGCAQGAQCIQTTCDACSLPPVEGGSLADASSSTDGGTSTDAATAPDQSSGTGSTLVACMMGTTTNGNCNQQMVPASLVGATQNGCTGGGGMVLAMCPSGPNLQNCCATARVEVCGYGPMGTAMQVMASMSSCVSMGGTYKTMP